MQKILVIGSEGYLGSRIIEYLNSDYYKIVGIDVGYFRYGVLYNPKNILQISKSSMDLSEKDLINYDVVLMLAGISNDPYGNLDYKEVYDPTRIYTIKIAKICKKLGIRFIFPSSCSVYGIAKGKMDENGETNPQTPYSLNKIQIERDLSDLADKTFSPIALRLATVFGPSPRIRFDLVINMLCGMAVVNKKIILNSNGQAWRPNVFIDDVCEAFKCCIDWKYDEGKLLVLNVGKNNNNMKIIGLAKIIQSKTENCNLIFLNDFPEEDKSGLYKDKKILDGIDKRTYQVNFDKILNKLPFYNPKWSVEEGIDNTLRSIKKWKLDEIKFRQREFYRLQQMEYLFDTKQLYN